MSTAYKVKEMLIKNFYNILSKNNSAEGEYLYTIAMDPSCEVYKGHFPGKPVAPGVCNVQMIKECAEDALQATCLLSSIGQCRFSALVTPATTPELDLKITFKPTEGDTIKFNATLFKGETVYIDMRGELTKQ